MSFWLVYVVIEGGHVGQAVDYHGYGFLKSAADGPDAVLGRVADGLWPCQEGDLNDAYEAAMLIDVDRRVLAAWDYENTTHRYRHALLSDLRQSWSGYDVYWAYGGQDDITAYVGHSRTGADVAQGLGWKPYRTWHAPDESFFLVTVDDSGYALAEGEDPDNLLAGPEEAATLPDAWRIENLAVWWHHDEPVPLPNVGLHLDTASRTVTGWTVRTVEDVAERWATAWPGWRWVFEHDRYDRHYARCDELVRMFLPEPLPGDGWPPLLSVRRRGPG